MAEPSKSSECPICMEKIEDRAIVKICRHEFCVKCFIDAMKVSRRCPSLDCKDDEIRYCEVDTNAESQTIILSNPKLMIRRESSVSSPKDKIGIISREEIYRYGLYAEPIREKATGRPNHFVLFLNPKILSENRIHLLKVEPLIKKDLKVLLGNYPTQHILNRLQKMMVTEGILSAKVVEYLSPYLREQTFHFIHELSNFLSSVYSVNEYVRLVQYNRPI